MDKRRFERKRLKFNADIITDNNFYSGSMIDLSEGGLCQTVHAKEVIGDLVPGKMVAVRFQFSSGEKFCMYCEIKRIDEKADVLEGKKYDLGMEIIDPLPEYKKTIKKL
ncbi:MAG: PilZ domain-containing protein [Nitrospirae bacterium]|nr:PilZ domain-containing protein [Nitrospirota bacterium]